MMRYRVVPASLAVRIQLASTVSLTGLPPAAFRDEPVGVSRIWRVFGLKPHLVQT